jgi:hypothetical protein
MGNGKVVFDVGGGGGVGDVKTFCIQIISFACNLGCWGCSINLAQNTSDYKDMGAR